MASPRTDRHRRELGLIAGLTARDVRAEARRADTGDIDGWWAGGAGSRIADIVARGFRATAVLGVEYLTASALAEGVVIEPIMAAVDLAQLATSLRVTGPVAFKVNMRRSGSPAAALRVMETRLGGSAQRLALSGERETVMEAVRTSPAIIGYRRVTAAGACKFCEMLAGRGAVYTRESATAVVGRRGQTRGTRSIGEPYHDSCRCSAEPIWDEAVAAGAGGGGVPPSSPPAAPGRDAAVSEPDSLAEFRREMDEAAARRVAIDAERSSGEVAERLARSRERQLLFSEDRRRREATQAARDRGEIPELDRPVSLSARAERHDNAMTELLSAVAEEAAAVSRDDRSGVQGLTEIVTLADGRRFVSKAIHAEVADAAGDLDREVLANAVGRAVGAEVPAMVRTGELALKMEFIDGAIADSLPYELRTGAVESDSARLMGLLDVLIGNTDRHGANWFVRDGRPVAIDHGFAWRPRLTGGFNEAGPWDDFAGHFLSSDPDPYQPNDMSPADMAVIRGRLEALEPDFVAAGREDWFRVTMDRFDRLAAAATGDRRRLAE